MQLSLWSGSEDVSFPRGWESISPGCFSPLLPLRNRNGLSFWAYLLPSFYCLPALLLSFELGDLSFYFLAPHFFSFWSVFFFFGRGERSLFFFSSKKAFAFLPLSSSSNITTVVTECDCWFTDIFNVSKKGKKKKSVWSGFFFVGFFFLFVCQIVEIWRKGTQWCFIESETHSPLHLGASLFPLIFVLIVR